MTPSPIAWHCSPLNIALNGESFDHCSLGPAHDPAQPAEAWNHLEAPDGDHVSRDEAGMDAPRRDEPERVELDGDELDMAVVDEALFELDGLDDDEHLPEYGDFWIDTDDVDAV